MPRGRYGCDRRDDARPMERADLRRSQRGGGCLGQGAAPAPRSRRGSADRDPGTPNSSFFQIAMTRDADSFCPSIEQLARNARQFSPALAISFSQEEKARAPSKFGFFRKFPGSPIGDAGNGAGHHENKRLTRNWLCSVEKC